MYSEAFASQATPARKNEPQNSSTPRNYNTFNGDSSIDNGRDSATPKVVHKQTPVIDKKQKDHFGSIDFHNQPSRSSSQASLGAGSEQIS